MNDLIREQPDATQVDSLSSDTSIKRAATTRTKLTISQQPPSLSSSASLFSGS